MNKRSPLRVLAALAMLLSVITVAAGPASADPSDQGCVNRNQNQIDKILKCIDADDALEHLAAFQGFADANGGIRASGTPGYDASVDYVAGLLEEAGLAVTRQEFSFDLYTEISSSLSIDGVAVETQTMEYSGSADIADGNVVGVDLDLGLGNNSTSGCEPSDFDGLDFSGPADIAVTQRGACAFATKAINAEAAGAEAVVIFNQGNAEGRFDIIGGTLGGPSVTIPVLDVSYDDGVALSSTAGVVALSADTIVETRTTENVIADLPGKNPDNVVMAGAHLDSVQEGPGIQDNGSGSAAILAVALELANNKKFEPENSLRFAWWGAEESGLIGSFEYFTNTDFGLLEVAPEEIDKIAAYINFDMIASPNWIYGVYDADQSSFEAPVPVPDGSAALEDLFEAYYTIEGVPYEDTQFSGRSDYQVFILLDIPASGLFTGAEGIKTDEQAGIWGGTAGDQYDPCYHLECDTFDNVGVEPLDVNIDAIAYAMFNLAATTESVNGVVGADVKGTTPADIELDGPQGTFIDEDGGGFNLDKLHPTE